jgi:hypothetical protein
LGCWKAVAPLIANGIVTDFQLCQLMSMNDLIFWAV